MAEVMKLQEALVIALAQLAEARLIPDAMDQLQLDLAALMAERDQMAVQLAEAQYVTQKAIEYGARMEILLADARAILKLLLCSPPDIAGKRWVTGLVTAEQYAAIEAAMEPQA